MELKVYNRKSVLKLTVSPSENSTRQKRLMGDHVLGLSFTAFECVPLEVYDYVDFEGVRFWITEEYAPKQTSTVEWEYDCKFYGIESLMRQALVLKLVDGENDPIFSLTAPAREHMALIVANINRQMGTTDWKVGEVLSTENLTLDYEGTYCDEALSMLADAAKTEFWTDGMTVNLCRCEYGDEAVLGYDNGLVSLERDSADNVKFFTRLFPIGSTRNIAPEEYGYSRLQLPSRRSYVEQNTQQGIVEHYERDAFSGIYPRRIGTLSGVRSEQHTDDDGEPFTIYYVKDTSLTFDPNSYEIGGLVKQMTFQSGELNGRDFEVNYDTKKREFEIITQWPYDDDTQLPGGLLIPKVGDEYILWNIRMPKEYYTLAEQEFAEAVDEYLLEHDQDRYVYKGRTDYVEVARRRLTLDVGRRVRLESNEYFPGTGYRTSRITSISQSVQYPSEMDIEVSDVLGKGALEKIDEELGEVRHYAKTASAGLPDIVRSWENTPASDFNLFSAKRSRKEFLNKRENDTAQGLITFEQGLRLGGFKSGIVGGEIDAAGNAELLSVVVRSLLRSPSFVDGLLGSGWQLEMDADGISHLAVDRLTVRQTMRVLELLVEKVRSVGGELVVSAADGKVSGVDMDASGQHYLLTFEMGCPFIAGDLVRCKVEGGAASKSYWVEIASVEGGVARVAASEFGDALPAVGDECVLMGSTSDPQRQGLILISATDDGQPRIDVMNGVSGKTLAGCLHARMGNLDGIADSWFPADDQPHGYGLYADNAYLRGRFLLTTGEDVLTKFEVMEGTIRSSVESMRNDFTTGQSFLNNPNFGNGMRYWDSDNDIAFFTLGGKWLWVNGAPYSNKGSYAGVEYVDGRTVMCINNNYILQKNADFKTRPAYEPGLDGLLKAKPVFLTFFYKCTEPGTLDIVFEGVDQTGFQNFQEFHITQDIAAGEGYRTFEGSGLWNGTGDFRLSFSGKMYLYMLMLSLDHIEDFVYSHKTLFEQTDLLVKIATESFDKDGNLINTTGLVSREDVAGMYAIAGDGTLQSFVGASTEGVFIKAASIKLEGLVTANGNFRILEDGSVEAANGVFKGEIEATSGTIGGFEIGRNRIGAVASQTGSGGSLAIYENFFRVGGDSGYVMLGNDVIPASAGGAFSAAGRVVNRKQNTGAQWGFDTANYGLFIDVSGGTKNYGVSSNAALIAPSFVGTKAGILTFDSGSYKVDFSQHNVILMYYNDPNYSGMNVELPSELSVARQFGLSVLPDDFAATVTFRVRPGSKRITLQGIYNHNEALVDYGMEAGDSVAVLITKIDGFRYQILNHSS
ncbi:hypothetical protein [Alistipes putredinis]|jgi:hypothetical protein|uniref:hypothetical protein n=1 Tax=Alistipes putredinis TaxID=28117 RepID=UPI00399596FB|nr:hypothetical protein [Alistipes putredinis]